MIVPGEKPEVISHNICTGPGSGSMLRAVEIWQRLAEQMSSEVVEPFGQLIQTLEEQWSGPAAKRMSQAVEPFAQWLYELSYQGSGLLPDTASRAARLHMAYGAARRMVVDPQTIDDNRELIQELSMNNEFERNTAAIMDLDRAYKQYSALDQRALWIYDVTVSSELQQATPWAAAPPITNEAGFIEWPAPAQPSNDEGWPS